MGAVRKSPRDVFCTRLRQARLAAGLSQKDLGVRAGLDEFVASTRINRYELGIHQPDWDMVGRLAGVLRVPVAYLFAQEEALADMVLAFSKASAAARREASRTLKEDA